MYEADATTSWARVNFLCWTSIVPRFKLFSPVTDVNSWKDLKDKEKRWIITIEQQQKKKLKFRLQEREKRRWEREPLGDVILGL